MFVASTVAAEVLALVRPAVLARVVDDVLAGARPAALTAFVIVVAAGAAAHALGELGAGRYNAARYYRSQVDIAEQVLRQGVVGRMSRTPGEVATRRNEAEHVALIPVFFTNVAVRSVLTGASLMVLFVYHWTLAVGAAGSVVALTVALQRLASRLDEGFDRLHTLNERATEAYLDAVGGRRTIAACGLLDTELDRISRHLTARAASEGWVRSQQGNAAAILAAASIASQGAVFVTGVWLLGNGDLTGGELVAALIYARMFYDATFANLNEGWLQLPFFRSLARRHHEFLALPPALPEPFEPAAAPTPPVSVELRDVGVGNQARTVLEEVDLHLGSGSLAIVGESGVGKSTIGHLVGRLVVPDRGTVTLGATDVGLLGRHDLASLVAYAFERPAMLGATIREFVTVGRPIDDEQVWEALHAAAASEFVERLPWGLDEPVEDAPFSGGEWQRLGIARAVAGRPAVLVLDDPTSSLDTITEVVVRDRLRHLTSRCTVIVVVYRATMAAWADQVAWLRHGSIVAVAPHGVLWRQPEYRGAWGAGG